jgi:hypothetical protein
MMQETLFPMGHKFLSPQYVQPMVDKYIALTYRHLEGRANQYNGLNVALRDFIVSLTFEASSRAFFGKDCPIDDLFKPFKLFDNNFHLFLGGIPKMFIKGPVKALGELATILDEKYFSKPNALDDASELIQEYKRVAIGEGFVSYPLHMPSLRFDGLSGRPPEMLLHSPSLSSGPSKRTPRLQRTGSLLSTSNNRTVSDHWSQRLTKLLPIGIPRTRPSL